MKNKIFVLVFAFLFLIACEKGIENPYSPKISNPGPVDPALDFSIEMGVSANVSTFSNDNDYATFYLRFIGYDAGFFSIANEQPINSITKILTVNFMEEYFTVGTNANFQLFQAGSSINLAEFSGYYWLKIIPISEGVSIGSVSDCGNTVDENGEAQIQFTGWQLKEYKTIYFKIIKTE